MVRIVIELPDQLKDFGVALQNAAEHMVQLAANNSSGKSMDYAKIEREVGDLTAAVERAGHQGLLAGLDLNAEKVVIDGALHTRVGRCEGAYHTMAGSVSVERCHGVRAVIQHPRTPNARRTAGATPTPTWAPAFAGRLHGPRCSTARAPSNTGAEP